MKKQDLDALRELYSSIYAEEFLLELPGQSQTEANRRAREAQATNRAIQGGRTVNANLSSTLGSWLTGQRGKVALNKAGELEVKSYDPTYELDKTIIFGGKGYNRKTGPDGKVTYVPASGTSTSAPRNPTPASGSTPASRNPTQRRTSGSTSASRNPTPASGSTSAPRNPTPPAPKPSGVVLARKNNVTGTLDKSTGKFTEKNWTDAETQRYQARAAQNAPKPPGSSTSAASEPKPPTPAVGKLGSTSFERRTPTSAELRAAKDARDKGASPEQALQAAQKTNLPTTGSSTATPDLESVSADLRRANPSATSAQIAGASQGIAPATSGTNSINNNKDKDKPVKEQSQEWPSAKTIRDIADAYVSIYEAKKNDGNLANNYPPYDKVTRGDVIAGRLGKDEMGGKKKSTKSEDFELWIDSLLDEGYDLSDYTWDDMYEIYEQQLDEGLGSAIRRVFGGRKEPEASPAPESRGAQLRRKYNVGPERSDTSAKRQILNRSLARAERDERDYGGSRYSKSVAQKSKEAHERYLRAGYSKYGASDARGRGSKARRRAEGLQREDYAIYEIVTSYLLENNFAETINDANVIIENMSEAWLEEILNNN